MPAAVATDLSLMKIPKLTLTPPPAPPSSPLLPSPPPSLPGYSNDGVVSPADNDTSDQDSVFLTQQSDIPSESASVPKKTKRKRVRFNLDSEPHPDSKHVGRTSVSEGAFHLGTVSSGNVSDQLDSIKRRCHSDSSIESRHGGHASRFDVTQKLTVSRLFLDQPCRQSFRQRPNKSTEKPIQFLHRNGGSSGLDLQASLKRRASSVASRPVNGIIEEDIISVCERDDRPGSGIVKEELASVSEKDDHTLPMLTDSEACDHSEVFVSRSVEFESYSVILSETRGHQTSAEYHGCSTDHSHKMSVEDETEHGSKAHYVHDGQRTLNGGRFARRSKDADRRVESDLRSIPQNLCVPSAQSCDCDVCQCAWHMHQTEEQTVKLPGVLVNETGAFSNRTGAFVTETPTDNSSDHSLSVYREVLRGPQNSQPLPIAATNLPKATTNTHNTAPKPRSFSGTRSGHADTRRLPVASSLPVYSRAVLLDHNATVAMHVKPLDLISRRNGRLLRSADLSRRSGPCGQSVREERSGGQKESADSTGTAQPVEPKVSGPLVKKTGFAKLDLTTLQSLGWADNSKLSPASLPLVETSSVSTTDASTNTIDPSLTPFIGPDPLDKNFGLTKVEFRRLTEQVRDVGNIIKNKFKTTKPSHEKLFRLTPVTSPDPATQALHVELQASRYPFQPRQWRPLTPDSLPEPTYTRCRPVSSRPPTAQPARRSSLAQTPGPERPRSVPLHGNRTPHTPRPPASARPDTPLVTPGNFDTLSPRILSQLLNDVSPRPPSASYGDRVLTSREKRRQGKDDVDSFSQMFYDDVSTTSGFDSDYGGEEDEDEEDDDDSDSEHGGLEPSLDEARRKIPNPQAVLHLRPERLDSIYIPEDKRDMRRFDFDATNVYLPPYAFANPLPDNIAAVNLKLCVQEGRDWRDQVTKPTYPIPNGTPDVVAIMDRLMELERLQMLTEDWEKRRLRVARRQQSSTSQAAASRATSAKVRDKRCCQNCLQPACVGDCPDKRLNAGSRNTCDHCHQPLCTGACQDTRYEERMRHSRSSNSLDLEVRQPAPGPAKPPTRGCQSCQARHNAKLINANNLLLGRPKSSNATFSRGKASARPRDLRPASAANMNSSMLKDFEKLGIEPQQPTPPKNPYGRPRSRNGLLPGKTSRSNRKNSLTDTSYKKKKSRTRSAARATVTS